MFISINISVDTLIYAPESPRESDDDGLDESRESLT